MSAPLARLQATIALEGLFDHFPDLDLAVPESEPAHQRRFSGTSVETLPVRPARPTLR